MDIRSALSPRQTLPLSLLFILFLNVNLGHASNPMALVQTTSGVRTVTVAVADSPHERAKGLMHKRRLDDEQGMYFLFPQEAFRTFWMKDVLIHLDIIFIDATGRIVTIARNVPPCAVEPCPLYRSGKPAKGVLEVRGGWCDKYGVREGGKVEYRP